MTSVISLRSLHSGPTAGFDEPFEMLAACHERVERMLGLLARLIEHVQAQPRDDSAVQAARDVMRYFDLAAPHHHEDEERHVFPALLAHADARIVAGVRRLQEDHRQMSLDWREARASLLALAEARIERFSAQDLERLARFSARYADHIRLEEEQIYPAARAGLTPAELLAAGQEMAKRRGVTS
ncbi:MAG TPA: hemerythrin domain-containing protein [Burkholderiaceae bacterium]|jgi:hemerythrin-like domain-containing protein|nr:hemerythrin domain-containing protein [Burkholderiaceae bacterium]